MTKRHGLGTFELILLIIFFVMFAATFFMLWQFSSRSGSYELQSGDLLAEYQQAVELMADDTLTAVSCVAATETLVLEKTSGTKIEWRFYNNALYRKLSDNQPQILVSNLKEGGFTTAGSPPDFFSLWLVPIASDKMPLFTSFALRGNGL